MPVAAFLILLAFFYLVSTAAALVLSLMQDADVRRRYLFVPGLNTAWLVWALMHMGVARGGARAGKEPSVGDTLARREAYNANFSTFRPPWIRP